MFARASLVLVACLCSAEVTTSSPAIKPEDLFEHDAEAIQMKLNYFDAALLKELGEKENGNFVVSPASIKTLLGLVLEGSEGTTQAELLRVLMLPQNMTYARQALSSLQNSLQKTSNSKLKVDSVAQIFIASTLKTNSTYKKTVKDYYRADVSPQDFTSPEVATNNINNWIRTKTRALISDLVDQAMITPQTYAILTSAIYFDGKWKTKFPKQNTKDDCFYSEPSLQCHMVPMMAKTEELFYKFDQSLDSHVLQIPYKDERFSMVVVMPGKKDGMKQLTVDAVKLAFPHILGQLIKFEVNLKMPRFSMDYGTELKSTLEKLGVIEAFADNAQLPYMIHGRQSRVDAIVHKAKIDVNEKGTKGSAASAAAIVPLMLGPTVINLELNHSFFYFVYDQQSKTVLFAGRLSSVVAAASSSQPSVVPLRATGSDNNHQQTTNTASASTPRSNGQQSYAAPTNTANQPSYSQQSYSAPPNAFGSNSQSSYAAPANAFGSSGQPSYAAPANSYGSTRQPSYPAPANEYRPSSQPSYGNFAAGGSQYLPATPMASAQPSNQPSSVETLSSAARPRNLGVVNHRYNPQAPSSLPS